MIKTVNIPVSKLSVAQVIQEINKHVAGRNVDWIFFNSTSLLKGTLEICTSEPNHPCPGKTKSHYIGVHRESPTHRWRASISIDGKRLSLGRFETEEDAARAYDEIALKHRGLKAKLNFPNEVF